MPAQEAAYLEHWRQRWLAEERCHGEYLQMLKRDAEGEQREAEEEACQAAATQPALDMNMLWNMVFPWAGPPVTLIDLTHPEDDDNDV
ncbi:putative xyloglucan endotransglucosylase/hydrolase protein 30 [Hordeum vulgare]|nr:putative xyloglucan endotransglucosylase/hydrolase protein 30 [Hordeum vulgare]